MRECSTAQPVNQNQWSWTHLDHLGLYQQLDQLDLDNGLVPNPLPLYSVAGGVSIRNLGNIIAKVYPRLQLSYIQSELTRSGGVDVQNYFIKSGGDCIQGSWSEVLLIQALSLPPWQIATTPHLSPFPPAEKSRQTEALRISASTVHRKDWELPMGWISMNQLKSLWSSDMGQIIQSQTSLYDCTFRNSQQLLWSRLRHHWPKARWNISSYQDKAVNISPQKHVGHATCCSNLKKALCQDAPFEKNKLRFELLKLQLFIFKINLSKSMACKATRS